jgi:ribose transport system permease protein
LGSISKAAGERSAAWRSLLQNRILFLSFLIVLLSAFAGIAYGTFFTSENLKAVLLNISIDIIISVGMMILLISGVFDLTVGSVLAFGGAVTAMFLERAHAHPALSITAGIAASLFLGLFNGLLIAKIKVNHLIVGLANLGVIRGIVLLMIGSGIHRLPEGFLQISNAAFAGLNLPIWYMIAISLVFSFLLTKTTFFRRYYYLGGNEKASLFSGINVQRMRVYSFIITAGLSGISGIILVAKLGASIPTLGVGMELRSITACILGGASLAGGYGTILGAVLGVLFMGLVNNFMIVSRIDIAWQSIVVSGILLLAVTIDALIKKSSG